MSRRQELAVSTTIGLDQMKGFTLFTLRAAITVPAILWLSK